jgi:hypothetical protein
MYGIGSSGLGLMSKLCLHCFRRISVLAGRCPYCLEERQGVWGRLVCVLLILVLFFIIGAWSKRDWPFDRESVRAKVRKIIQNF